MEIFCEKKLIMFAFLTSQVKDLWVVLLPCDINCCSGCKNQLNFLQDVPFRNSHGSWKTDNSQGVYFSPTNSSLFYFMLFFQISFWFFSLSETMWYTMHPPNWMEYCSFSLAPRRINTFIWTNLKLNKHVIKNAYHLRTFFVAICSPLKFSHYSSSFWTFKVNRVRIGLEPSDKTRTRGVNASPTMVIIM